MSSDLSDAAVPDTDVTEDAVVPYRRSTIKEVAEAAGVSRSTASRALAGTGYVAEPVRARVRNAAKKLGYVVDVTARSLKQQSSRLIGVVVSDLKNPFYAGLASGAARAARAAGYTTVLIDDGDAGSEESYAAEALVSLRVAGIVGTPVSDALVTFAIGHGIPVVEVDRRFVPRRASGVVVDNRAAARAATEHLLALGHRRIALLVDETEWTTGQDRLDGYTDALRGGGLPVDDSIVVTSGWDAEDARNSANALFERADRPTAVFAVNNLIAEGVWRAAHDRGLRIPADLSLVAFDDAAWMSMVEPGVTAVVQDPGAIGVAAVEAVLAKIRQPGSPPATVVVPTRVVHRGSTAALAR
ncbi:LacI family DNA-binding transcriptional regulator [uncultured Microbacterium sp.]|uniref:LacI family DNA-binding transcriptional regulator n=1 Tax=uncultured Microbacterium sp. TaxID=191216 RepID=UPI0028D79342|nr:LacI family DNA-binding transcriptional regulator [uncultured Microbacterium sp.]